MPLAWSSAAHATQSISCSDMKGDSGIDILLGAGPVPNVLSVTLSLGERQLTTEPGLPGEKMTIAQAYDDGEFFRIDLMDDQVTRRVAAIRLILAGHQPVEDRHGPDRGRAAGGRVLRRALMGN